MFEASPEQFASPSNDVALEKGETQSFLESLQPGDKLYLKNDEGAWIPATFLSVQEGGLHGPVVKLDAGGEPRTMYPKILMDLQRQHDETGQDMEEAA